MGNLRNEDSKKYEVKVKSASSTSTFSIDSKSTIVGKFSRGNNYTVTVVGGGTCKCSGDAVVTIKNGVPTAVEPKEKPAPSKPTEKDKSSSSSKPSSSSSSSSHSSRSTSSTRSTVSASSESSSSSAPSSSPSTLSSSSTSDSFKRRDYYNFFSDERQTSPDDRWTPLEPSAFRHRASEFWDKPEDWGGTTPFEGFERLVTASQSFKPNSVTDFLTLLDKEMKVLGDDGWKLLVHVHRPFESLPPKMGWLLIDYCLSSSNGSDIARVVTRKIFQCSLEAKERGDIDLAQKLRLASALLFYRIVEFDGAWRVWQTGRYHNIEAQFFPGVYLAPKNIEHLHLLHGLKTGRCGIAVLWAEAAVKSSFAHEWYDEMLSSPLVRRNICSAMMNPGLMTQILIYIGRYTHFADFYRNVEKHFGLWVFEHPLINWRWFIEASLVRASTYVIEWIWTKFPATIRDNMVKSISDEEKKAMMEHVCKITSQSVFEHVCWAIEKYLGFLNLPLDILEESKKKSRSWGIEGTLSYKNQPQNPAWNRLPSATIMKTYMPTDTTPNPNYDRPDDAFHQLVGRQWKPSSSSTSSSSSTTTTNTTSASPSPAAAAKTNTSPKPAVVSAATAMIDEVNQLLPDIAKGDKKATNAASRIIHEYQQFKGIKDVRDDFKMYHAWLGVAPYMSNPNSPFDNARFPVQDMGWGTIDAAVLKHHAGSFWTHRDLWSGENPPASFGALWDKMVGTMKGATKEQIPAHIESLEKELQALGDDGWKFLVYPHRGSSNLPGGVGWLLLDILISSPDGAPLGQIVYRAIFKRALEAKEKGDLVLAQKLRLASALLFYRAVDVIGVAVLKSSGTHNLIECQFFPVLNLAKGFVDTLGLGAGSRQGLCGYGHVFYAWRLHALSWDQKLLALPHVQSAMTIPGIFSDVLVRLCMHAPDANFAQTWIALLNAMGGPWVVDIPFLNWSMIFGILFSRGLYGFAADMLIYPNLKSHLMKAIGEKEAQSIIDRVARMPGGKIFKLVIDTMTSTFSFLPWPKASIEEAKSHTRDPESMGILAYNINMDVGLWGYPSVNLLMTKNLIYDMIPNPSYKRPDDAFHQLVGRQWVQPVEQFQEWLWRIQDLEPLVEKGDEAAIKELKDILSARSKFKGAQPLVSEKLFMAIYERNLPRVPGLPNPHCPFLVFPPAHAAAAPPSAAKK